VCGSKRAGPFTVILSDNCMFFKGIIILCVTVKGPAL
jgi:hypothetical protein